MTEQCALCTDTEATARITPKHKLVPLAAQNDDIDVRDPDMVIPLCARCADDVSWLIDELRDYDTPDERDAIEGELEDIAERLTPRIVESASLGH